MAQMINGVVINEILAAPGGFDTDMDGSSTNEDEFVELFNTTGSPVDISGWTLQTDSVGGGTVFTFPGALNSGTTFISAGGKVVVVGEYTGTLPTDFFEGLPAIDAAGDAITLSQGGTSITAFFDNNNGFPIPTPNDNFGPETNGESLDRVPDGTDTIVSGTPNPECFLTGTLILTENGYKAVEELEIGDLVKTADRKIEAVKWIGYQTINPNQIKNPLRGNPIQIKAGALGDNLPLRDLYVSPDHSMLVDGLLINAGALVNDISIVQTEPTETFVYHSVELENHCLLLAEGTAAESYLPQKENRDEYDNFAEYEELYPQGSNLMLWPMDYPRISSWNKVPRFVSKKLMKIAHQLFGQEIQLQA